ncbi:ribosomal L1p/L10e family protein [Neorickettsia helminthoeca str. Oregon]|uniref:Ribosomal protein n=1 Tax=Neorickettsia helminthoeca str. Oregon TaxID=1286528 RepID=X5HKK4_9RICK|nr:50S ribosomal protein L1 [Neorickettsia helminthoeca]AHX11579.1 ribosomal L1p/L10e family protein [Neorickettsia helminthoeca str. Oregon]
MKEVLSIDVALKEIMQKEHKFDEALDVAVHFVSTDSVKGSCVFNHSFDFGRILVFSGDTAALHSFGDKVSCGGEELMESIKSKKSLVRGHKYSVSTPAMMPKLSRVARILGPRGLMPDSKYGLVTDSVVDAVSSLLSGKSIFKSNKAGVLHCKVGKLSMGFDKLRDNFQVFCESVFSIKPKSVSLSNYINSISLSSTMGSGYFIDFSAL